MTTIRIEQIGSRLFLAVSGHADYAESGKDIVCASVSTLAQSFIYLCEEETDRFNCSIIEKQIKEGFIYLIVESYSEIIDGAFRMLRLGIEAISNTYPQNVTCGGEI